MLSTDYANYAIVYSCTSLFAGAFCFDYLWVLSKQPYVIGSAEALTFKSMTEAIIKQKLPDFDLGILFETIQGGTCKYNIQ